jgi:uncharacterized flavoprotein (TIGR03862 family)
MTPPPSIAIIGAGPAGLIAAEHLARAGCAVTVYERSPSPLRKFLLAGRGGLNLTHSEPLERFLPRYGDTPAPVADAIRAFPPEELRQWAVELGEETFVGSSGRVFPKSFKATPLARAWLRRLEGLGVALRARHLWTGWDTCGALTFETPEGTISIRPDATLLALGGASWPRLGSDGSWQPLLAARGITITPLEASNAGVLIQWSEPFRQRNAGAPLKACGFTVGGVTVRAEAVITSTGLEGGAVYALSPALRAALATGPATLTLDLKPDVPEAALAARIAAARPGESLSNLLRKAAGLPPVALGLLREATGGAIPREPSLLAAHLKALPLTVIAQAGLARAISTAGGVAFSEVDATLQLKAAPGVWVAGEMLDWDAPTGGYLLQASFATGRMAAAGMVSSVLAQKA